MMHKKLLCRVLCLISCISALFLCMFSSADEELITNNNFFQNNSGWVKYSNFVYGQESNDWSLDFTNNGAIIEGRRCQPQTRIGFRSEKIKLNTDFATTNSTQIYQLNIVWEGKNIHRSGAYFNMFDGLGSHIRTAEILGPAGDFSKDEKYFFHITREYLSLRPSLMIYIFHDGIGTLKIKKVSLIFLDYKTMKQLAPNIELSLENGRDMRKSNPISEFLVIKDIDYIKRCEIAMDILDAKTLLPQETRLVKISPSEKLTSDFEIAGKFNIENRPAGKFWEYGVEYDVPFWLKPADINSNAQYALIMGNNQNTRILPPLPKNKHAYLYYYGNYRYGKMTKDLERDLSEMKFIKAMGFTGVCLQDNYGMDYAGWLENKMVDSHYLLNIAEIYKRAGFTSPMVYGIFSGLDKMRVAWNKDDDHLQNFLNDIKPHIEKAQKILGNAELWIAPVDEPNDAVRRSGAEKIIPEWKNTIKKPLMITCNWKTAGALTECDNRWVGAGEYPSFDEARLRGIKGFYTGLNACENPLKFRWLAGIHSWASGLDYQAYWHFDDLISSDSTDLDGTKEDFLCIKPECDINNPIISMPFIALKEGLIDLRLLCALEEIVKNPSNKHAAKISEFLSRIKSLTPPTDRLTSDWDEVSDFQKFRIEAVSLWNEANTDK